MKRSNHREARTRRPRTSNRRPSDGRAGYVGVHCTKQNRARGESGRAVTNLARPVAAAAATVMCVACATVAFSCSFPTEYRQDTERPPASSPEKPGQGDVVPERNGGVKSEATSQMDAPAGVNGASTEAGGDAAGLMIDAMDGFAVWARGRLAVSSGGSEDELVLEVDPATERLRAWVDAAIDGRLEVAGDVRARSIGTVGEVAGGTVSAGALNAAEATLGRLGAEEASMQGAAIVQMAAEQLKALDAVFGHAAAERLSSEEIEASKVAASGVVEAGNAEIGRAEIESAEVRSGSFGSLSSRNASFAAMLSDAVSAIEASIAHIGAQSADISEVRAGGIRSTSVSTDSMKAGELATDHIEAQTMACSAAEIAQAGIESLAVQALQATSVRTGQVAATEASFSALSSGSIEADRIGSSENPVETFFARAATVAGLVVEGLSANSIDAGEVVADTAVFEELSTSTATIGSLGVDALNSASAKLGSIEVGDMRAEDLESVTARASEASFETVDAVSASAQSISCGTLTGTLAGLSVDGSSAGIAVFAPIEANGAGADQACAVTTSPDADALIVTPASSDCPYVCSWEVREIEPGSWEITRRFGPDAAEAMVREEFPAQGEIAVYWLAIDFE